MDGGRGRRLAHAATQVIAAARRLRDRNMQATDGCAVVLIADLAELADALDAFDRARDGSGGDV